MTNKKIIVSTWCTDDWQKSFGIEPLQKTFKHFHPDIDFDIIGTDRTTKAKEDFYYIQECMNHEEVPWYMRGKTELFLTAPLVFPYINSSYDMIVHIDADSIVLGNLDDIFLSDEDVISVYVMVWVMRMIHFLGCFTQTTINIQIN